MEKFGVNTKMRCLPKIVKLITLTDYKQSQNKICRVNFNYSVTITFLYSHVVIVERSFMCQFATGVRLTVKVVPIGSVA